MGPETVNSAGRFCRALTENSGGKLMAATKSRASCVPHRPGGLSPFSCSASDRRSSTAGPCTCNASSARRRPFLEMLPVMAERVPSSKLSSNRLGSLRTARSRRSGRACPSATHPRRRKTLCSNNCLSARAASQPECACVGREHDCGHLGPKGGGPQCRGLRHVAFLQGDFADLRSDGSRVPKILGHPFIDRAARELSHFLFLTMS